jgi:hypothetical protein
VAELRLAGWLAVVDAAAGDQPAADAAAERDVEDRVGPPPGAVRRFAEAAGVGVVVHRDGQAAADVAQPVAQGETFPAVDLVRAADAPGPHVDRPAEPDADRAGAELSL